MNNFIVIEASVYLDTRLNSTDVLIYGLIDGLSNNNERECFASNRFLASKRKISIRQVQRSLDKLSKLNYIIMTYKNSKRSIKTYVNNQISNRDKDNGLLKKSDLFNYDWLNDD